MAVYFNISSQLHRSTRGSVFLTRPEVLQARLSRPRTAPILSAGGHRRRFPNKPILCATNPTVLNRNG